MKGIDTMKKIYKVTSNNAYLERYPHTWIVLADDDKEALEIVIKETNGGLFDDLEVEEEYYMEISGIVHEEG